MTKKMRREKQQKESMARLDRHNNERRAASTAAAAQRKPIDGLKPAELHSIADALDEVDPKIRGSLGPLATKTINGMNVPAPTLSSPAYGKVMQGMHDVEHDVDERPGSPAAYRQLVERADPATEPIAAPYRDSRGEFVPPRDNPFVRQKDEQTNHREESTMSYTSPIPARATRTGVKGNQNFKLHLPRDIAEAIGPDLLESLRFTVEMDDEGLHFRPGSKRVAAPAWAQKNGTPAAAEASRARRV